MGLRDLLGAYAVSRAHVLAVEVPGSWSVRVVVDRAMGARGWRHATSPADADVLVLCGEPGEALAAVAERVWDQLPGPRARITLTDEDEVDAALDIAAAVLRNEKQQRSDAVTRPQQPAGDHGDMDHGGMDHSGMDHGDMDHGGVDDEGTDHSGMDHGDMDMAPAGIPLASSGGRDRDGLEMDVLNVPLGPVLPHWPAGLVLRCAVRGDVVTYAEVDVLPSATTPSVTRLDGRFRAARRCDGVARFLAVAGWQEGAAAAVRTREALLLGDPVTAAAEIERLHSRVARARSLRWLLRGLGRIDEVAGIQYGLPDWTRGDAHDRLLGLLHRAAAHLEGHPDVTDPRAVLAALPGLVAGLDLAAVRLVVASLDPDTSGLPVGAQHV